MTWADSLAPLRGRNFRLYFASRVAGTAGTAMATVALAFAVLQVTGDDPTALGLVLAAHSVPMVVLLLWGGVLADKLPRAALVQVCNLASAAAQGTLAVLVLTGTAELWSMAVVSAVHGTVSAASMPALAGVMPQLVPRAELQHANALVSLARSVLVVGGPTVSALLVVAVGPGWVLAVDAATWLVGAVLWGFVRLPPRVRDAAPTSMLTDLREGWAHVRGTQWLWVVVLGFGVLNMIHAGAWLTLGPLRAKETFGAQGWGLVLSAEAVGLLAMTLVMLRVPLRRPLLVGMLAVSTLALPIVVLGARPGLLLTMAAALLAGAGTEVFVMGWNLAMQENVPEEMLSRVYSYDMVGSFVAIPLGQLVAGPLAVALGYGEVLVAAGVLYVVVCGLVLLSPQVRGLTRRPAVPERAPASGPAPPPQPAAGA